jgi:hypothetical protein
MAARRTRAATGDAGDRLSRRSVAAERRPFMAIQAIFDWRSAMLDVVLKRFEKPDEIREFQKGRFEIVRLGGMTIGRATYQPGWRWSIDVGPATGAISCKVEHVGMVISGCATAAMDDGRVIEMRAGDIFYIPPGHDSWVVGNEPYVSLHFLGADEYARKG